MKIKLLTLFSLGLSCIAASSHAQSLVIQAGGSITTTAGASIVVQGSVKGDGSITGPGTLVMSGTTASTLDMANNSVPNLQIDNPANVTLLSGAKVTEGVQFTNGKLVLGANNIELDGDATISGQTNARFFETNGTGEVQKLVTGNLTNFAIPVGVGTNYRPIELTTSGTYASAKLGVRNANGAAASKPVSTTDHLLTNWPVSRTGITGTVSGKGTYLDADITGIETNIKGYYHNGTSWSSVSETSDELTNTVSAPITAASGTLTGIDKFIMISAKAFLQGAYIASGAGSMTQTLRTPTLYIPTTSPYGVGVYASTHAQVSNPLVETSSAAVFNANNIVDWVQLQLRNTATPSGNLVLQTRSALLKSDGSIVDVDGVSPITFNNVANANYVLAVRHRNHLGLSTNPAVAAGLLAGSESATASFDFTNPANTGRFGSATAYKLDATTNKVLLWAGNVNGNTQTKYSGPGNDPAQLLLDLGGNPNTILSGYLRGDVNMNGQAKYSGPGNDTGVMLSAVLSGNPNTIRTQELPQ